ncbi:BQ5605_C003g02031 [Microbotryum silenes-dioicae]|uniref:Peroxisome assembly protein 12 n=1 Tax=Microbotryum silenes-dioicae TaxID=796604 RepID=A0A2X0P399_9BASI|nr:BQ5605_C003g02031 [Microbotryum silenes-dioicae]
MYTIPLPSFPRAKKPKSCLIARARTSSFGWLNGPADLDRGRLPFLRLADRKHAAWTPAHPSTLRFASTSPQQQMEFLSDVGGGEDRHRPSFFELAAQEQLRDLLAPVVRYILSVFAQRNPRYLLRIVNRHDEFFAVVMFFVERHYLKAWGASFAENFYGLKRRRVLGTGSDKTKAAVGLTGRSDKLGKAEIRASLIFLIFVPYLRSKGQESYERLGGGVDSDLFSDTPAGQRSQLGTSSRVSSSNPSHINIMSTRGHPSDDYVHACVAAALQSYLDAASGVFKSIHPYANAAYELYLLSYSVRYLFNSNPFWRPWFSWMSIEVRRMSAEDYVSAPPSCPQKKSAHSLRTDQTHATTITQRAAHETTSNLLSSPIRRHHTTGLPPSNATVMRRSLSLIPLLSFEALKFLLPTSIFFFRFLEWWYSPEGGYGRLRRKGGAGAEGKALRAPPQGPLLKDHAAEMGMCCVHNGPMVNPTALPTGWLGCYKCVHGWVEEEGACPVTGSSVALRELRKILG